MSQFLYAFLLAGCALTATAQDAKIAPAAGQEWTNAFASSRADVVYNVQTPAGFRGRLAWTFSDVGTGRVLPRGRGETPVTADTKIVKFTLDFPPLNPGVALKANLSVTLIDDATRQASAEHARTMWILYADPFAGRAKEIEALKIALYDADSKRATTNALNLLKIPFEQVDNSAALAERTEGVVLIGEGVSFTSEPELPKTLLALAKRGLTVICLAPADGVFALPSGSPDDGDDVSFLRRSIITKLDSRLDARAWLHSGNNLRSTIAITSVEGSVMGEVKQAGGFPWLQVDYPETKGRLMMCGFGVIQNWSNSPTPRYLLDAMFVPRDK